MPKRIVMDVDTGIDDALAILYAVGHPNLELLGISCVPGNVALDQVVINTCKVLDAAGVGDIPVAAGAREPLVEEARREGGGSHGANGLGGIQLPQSSRRPSSLHAVELLNQLIMDSPGPVSLVTLGPKTNVALLLSRHPHTAARLDRILFMGGSVTTQVAEFNVWQDPEAAARVIKSSIPIVMYGLDLFDRLVVEQTHIDRFRSHDHPAIRLAADLLGRRPRQQGPHHDKVGLLGDAGALVLLTNPDLFMIEELPVRVELAGVARGRMIINRDATPKNQSSLDPSARVRVALDLDATKAASAFVETINAYAAYS